MPLHILTFFFETMIQLFRFNVCDISFSLTHIQSSEEQTKIMCTTYYSSSFKPIQLTQFFLAFTPTPLLLRCTYSVLSPFLTFPPFLPYFVVRFPDEIGRAAMTDCTLKLLFRLMPPAFVLMFLNYPF